MQQQTAERYIVEVTKRPASGAGNQVERVATTFNISAQKAEQLLERLPGIVTKPVPAKLANEVAERFQRAGLEAVVRSHAEEAVIGGATPPKAKPTQTESPKQASPSADAPLPGANDFDTAVDKMFASDAGSTAESSNFEQAGLEQADPAQINAERSPEQPTFEPVNFDPAPPDNQGSDTRNQDSDLADFNDANFDSADFDDSGFDSSDFDDSDLGDADFDDSDFNGSEFGAAELQTDTSAQPDVVITPVSDDPAERFQGDASVENAVTDEPTTEPMPKVSARDVTKENSEAAAGVSAGDFQAEGSRAKSIQTESLPEKEEAIDLEAHDSTAEDTDKKPSSKFLLPLALLVAAALIIWFFFL